MDKEKNISDKEMIRTFNCGVGFCIIAKKKKCQEDKEIFFLKILNLMKLDLFQKAK